MVSGGSQTSWKDIRDFARLVFLCVCWYTVSSANGVLGKWILSEFPHPMTLTLVQLVAINIFSRPMLLFLKIRPLGGMSRRYYWKWIVPLAVAKFASNVSAHFSIWKVPVSYAHTVKASMPLFTVFISRVFLGETYSGRTYLSLVPIVAGVAIATITEVSFDVVGLASALAATAILAGMAICTKKVNDETGVHTLRLLLVLAQLSLFMFLPVWFYFDFSAVIVHPAWTNENSTVSIVFLLFCDGVCHWLQNLVAFTVMSKVSKLSYAVASATKRVCIITVSLLLLQNHVTFMNVVGMVTAIIGVFLYNKVKLDEKNALALPSTNKQQQNGNYGGKRVDLWNNNITFPPSVQVATPVKLSNGLNGSYRPYQKL